MDCEGISGVILAETFVKVPNVVLILFGSIKI